MQEGKRSQEYYFLDIFQRKKMYLLVILGVVFLIIFICFLLILWARSGQGKYEIIDDIAGRSFLITGASSGIGLETALELAKHGAIVHMLCRNMEKANMIKERIKEESGNDQNFTWQLDTSQFKSVRSFAQKFLASDHNIDVLINNAGCHNVLSGKPIERTEDGLEKVMTTNHYGHFLLTNLLLDRLKTQAAKTGDARIVVVASDASENFPFIRAKFPLDDPYMRKGWYNNMDIYGFSKLANVLFTKELSLRLKDTPGITVNCLHPGLVRTKIGREMCWFLRIFYNNFVATTLARSSKEGSKTILYLATSPEVTETSGKYFAECKIRAPNPEMNDRDVTKKFWQISAEMTGLTENKLE